jgi:hypothetical protein
VAFDLLPLSIWSSKFEGREGNRKSGRQKGEVISEVIGYAANRAEETCGKVEVALRKTDQTMVQIAR